MDRYELKGVKVTSILPTENNQNANTSMTIKSIYAKLVILKVIKGKLPCQAVISDMYIYEIPQELASLAKLEQILVSKHIVFQRLLSCQKDNREKLKVQYVIYQLSVIRHVIICIVCQSAQWYYKVEAKEKVAI